MWNKARFYGFYRQASGIVPKNILTDPEYNNLEENYRNVRTGTLALIKHIEEMKTYEHGGPTYKMILEGFEKVKGKAQIGDEDLSDNMYNVGEKIFRQLADGHVKEEYKQVADKLARLNNSMSRTKHAMNKELAGLLVKLKTLKKDSINIDDERTKMKNAQFDAERFFEASMRRDPNVDPRDVPEVKSKIEEFEKMQDGCKRSMKGFVENSVHKDVLDGILKSFKNYLSAATSEIK